MDPHQLLKVNHVEPRGFNAKNGDIIDESE
jgi:hypothetical protein